MYNVKSIFASLFASAVALTGTVTPALANGIHGADIGGGMNFEGCVSNTTYLYNGIYNAQNTVSIPANQLDVWFADNATITVDIPVTWDLTDSMDQECLDQIIANGSIRLESWGVYASNYGNAELTVTSISGDDIAITALTGSGTMTVTLTANSDGDKMEFLDTYLSFYTHVVGNMNFTGTSF